MYAVIDVETANPHHKGSICSIGVVFVKDGAIVDSFYSLVRPLVSFNARCVSVHHITADTVANAPTFKELWPMLHQKIDGMPLVAYSATTDIYALEQAIYDAEIEAPDLVYADAYKIAQQLLDLPRYNLDSVCKHFNIHLEDAHNALADAQATAMVMLQMQKITHSNDLDGLLSFLGISFSHSLQNNFVPDSADAQHKHPKRKHSQRIVYTFTHPLAHGNCDYFKGKNVVFTGNLTCASRESARAAVTEMGGICKESPSKKTNICITGSYDKDTLCEGASIGKKLQYVLDLNNQGYQIEILSEQEFLEILAR